MRSKSTEDSIKGKVALITGSTSGIGLGIAKKLSQLECNIIINGFAENEEVDKISKQLHELGAASVLHIGADLSKPDQILVMFDEIKEQYGKLDILVNNAGIQHVAPIEQFPDEKWEAIMRIDLISSFYTIKYSIESMKKSGWGRIINIASAHGLVASPFKSAYVAAKHGMLGLTKTVALEVAEHGITVNSICPGYVKTPLVLGQIKDTAISRGITEDEVMRDVLLAAQPTKQFVEIEEVAELTAFLCSKSAKSINGAALSMDGGWVAH